MQFIKCAWASFEYRTYINGFMQDCSNSIANALELLQSCTKPWIWACWKRVDLCFIVLSSVWGENDASPAMIKIIITKTVFKMTKTSSGLSALIHLLLVQHIWIIDLDYLRFAWWLVACLALSHYLNQWWLPINHIPKNRFQWKQHQNWWFFIDKIALICNLSFAQGRWI